MSTAQKLQAVQPITDEQDEQLKELNIVKIVEDPFAKTENEETETEITYSRK